MNAVRGAMLSVALACALTAPPAHAQQLQTGKPIRLIVGLAPGGGTDVTARLIAQQISRNTGMTVFRTWAFNDAPDSLDPAVILLQFASVFDPAAGSTRWFWSDKTDKSGFFDAIKKALGQDANGSQHVRLRGRPAFQSRQLGAWDGVDEAHGDPIA